jgi:hypothetical protein
MFGINLLDMLDVIPKFQFFIEFLVHILLATFLHF